VLSLASLAVHLQNKSRRKKKKG